MRDPIPFFLAVCFLIVATSAHATFGPLRFSPLAPTSNDTLTVSVETFGCDVFIGGANGFNREIEIVGNVIKVIAPGISNIDFTFCFFPLADFTFNIGTVAAGSYTVELCRRQVATPAIVDLVSTGNILLVQGINTLTPVPSVSIFGVTSLLLLMLTAGVISISRPTNFDGEIHGFY